MRYRVLLSIGLMSVPTPSRADVYTRQPNIDVLHYLFRLALSDQSDEITGEATIHVRFVTDATREIQLDLLSRAPGAQKGMAVEAVTRGDAQPLAFEHNADRLRITLPAAPGPNERTQIVVRYRGVPSTGLRIGSNKYGERTFFGLNWPDKARGWLPMVDHPYDKATGEFIVTAPSQYQVVANGLLVEETDLPDGTRRTHWKQSVPISSWLFTLGVARFAVHHAGVVKGVPLSSWVFPHDSDAGFKALEGTAFPAIEFFSEYIGPYPYEKLANIQAAGFRGATEHASAILYGDNSIGERPVVDLVAHEIAHQWFGDAVTERDWDDVWLSEGFATYFALLFTEHRAGRDAFVAGLKRSRDQIVALEQKSPNTPVVHDNLSDMSRVLNQFVYQKGGWTLHMLRGIVGTDTFWAAIREYYRRYRDGSTSTLEFRRVVEEASGVDLAWFFRQWLNRSGVPRVEGGWRYDPVARQIRVEIEQTQEGEVFRLPFDLAIAAEGDPQPRVEKLDMRERQVSVSFASDRPPVSITLDPGTWVLMDARFVQRP